MRKPDPTKRDAILAAAKARFYRYGIQKTSMQEISGDVGISVGTLYLYFRNKDEMIIACTAAFADLHRQEIAKILALKKPTDEKLRQYVLQRFRASKATREGSDHASEIARAVITLVPSRLEEETQLLYETLTQLLQEGVEAGLFPSAKPKKDVEIFLYAIAYFFPVAGKEPVLPLEESKLRSVVDWFFTQWKREA